MKTLAQKMGIKEGAKTYLKDAPAEAVTAISLPDIALIKKLSGEFDYIHLFVKLKREQESISLNKTPATPNYSFNKDKELRVFLNPIR